MFHAKGYPPLHPGPANDDSLLLANSRRSHLPSCAPAPVAVKQSETALHTLAGRGSEYPHLKYMQEAGAVGKVNDNCSQLQH